MTRRRITYSGTVDSNGYPYCVNCGQSPDAHTDTRRTLYCPQPEAEACFNPVCMRQHPHPAYSRALDDERY